MGMAVVVYRNVLAAADLLLNAERSTPWIPARGARCVLFHWRSTNANAPQAAGVPQEGTNFEPLVSFATTAQTLSGTPAHLASPIPGTVHVLNNAGGVVHAVYPASGALFIQPVGVRMTIRGHATLTITALECVSATVIYDNESMVPAGAVAV